MVWNKQDIFMNSLKKESRKTSDKAMHHNSIVELLNVHAPRNKKTCKYIYIYIYCNIETPHQILDKLNERISCKIKV